MAFVPLIAPTTTDERMQLIAKETSGYVYLVSLNGVTGARTELPPDLCNFVSRARTHFGEIPISVGFGLSTKEHLIEVGKMAEGTVMGSAIIRAISKGNDTASCIASLKDFIATLEL